ncbi:MAG: PfkB family carbohydrate kinase [Planctomycetota bacterium]
MSDDRSAIAAATAASLRDHAARIRAEKALIGFDGFVDSIIRVVDKRHDLDHYDALPTIRAFGEKILAAAGKSANFELVTTARKLGGNGPIMANAMRAAGIGVTYIGALGEKAIDPVFAELADGCDEVVSLCDPGLTDAVEFDDGKLMLGKHASIRNINAPRLLEAADAERLLAIVTRSRLIAAVNWTMLVELESIWRLLAEEVLPDADPLPDGGRRLVFFDYCDPSKRTDADTARAMRWATRFQQHADAVIGLNLAEGVQAMRVLGLGVPDNPEASIESMATAIREHLKVHAVVVHPRAGAAAFVDGEAPATFAGPFTSKPKLSTGAGDNFNAGFCLGCLLGLPVEQRLCVGTATSGYYVRHAGSPTLEQLIAFIEELPPPKGE